MSEASWLPAPHRLALGSGRLPAGVSRGRARQRSMIGGLVAMKVDPRIGGLPYAGRRTALVTGTNGKSTTTRMLAAALSDVGPVATQADGANMDAGIIATLR